MSDSVDWLRPEWGARGVGALMTMRRGGVSLAPFDSMNVGAGVGDDPGAVEQNLRLLSRHIGVVPVLLNQVHGSTVVRVHAAHAMAGATRHTADASITTETGVACTAQVADCLPVLFAAANGRAVGAAHAGWRGLAGGVLEATLAALCEAAACAPHDVHAWLGACIGPQAFVVGADVLQAFGAAAGGPAARRFSPRGVPGKWLADLPALARDRLFAAGVRQVSGGHWCTVTEPSRFFSFRRDRITGRMLAAVWIEPGASRA